MRILILKPSSLGDVVQALPVLRLLKRHDVAHEIHWWIDARWRELLEGDPDLSGVIPFDRQAWRSLGGWRSLGATLTHVRSLSLDYAIDLQSLARSGVLCWLSGARWRVGLDDLREGASVFYDERVPRPGRNAHAVDWYCAVLRRLGVPVDGDFEWLPARRGVWEQAARRWGLVAGTRYVVLQPGARWDNKRWPVERYVAVARELMRDEPGLRVGVVGSAAERELGKAIQVGVGVGAEAVPPVMDWTGRTSLWEAIELLRHAVLFVGNDSGPMHLASAVGTPVVAVFGPTDERRTGPYGQLRGVVRERGLACAPCLSARCRHVPRLECLDRVGVADVLAVSRLVLGR